MKKYAALQLYNELSKAAERKGRQDLVEGGLGDDACFADVDPEQLRMGIDIEMEHTDDQAVAAEIALDHLQEDPQYYTHLTEMEKEHEQD